MCVFFSSIFFYLLVNKVDQNTIQYNTIQYSFKSEMGMGENGNESHSMGVGRELEQESHSRTPRLAKLFPALPLSKGWRYR